jgi:hypothetical protein
VRVGGEHVAITQDEVPGAQQRHELAFVTIGEVRGVNQAERRGREQFLFLAFARGALDEFG